MEVGIELIVIPQEMGSRGFFTAKFNNDFQFCVMILIQVLIQNYG